MEEITNEVPTDFIDDDSFIIVDKNMKDILSELDFNDEDEKLLCESIITSLERSIAKNLSAMKIVQLPFMGTLRINPVRKKLSKEFNGLRELRKTLTKDEYKEHMKSLVLDLKAKQKAADKDRMLLINIKRNNKKKYEELFKSMGKHYADMFIYSIKLLEEIPFDAEWEKQYKSLKNNE